MSNMISTTSLVENKKMSNLTWFGVGGSSKYYFQPSSEENLVSFLKNNQLDLPIYPLGAGSNIIIRDRGFNGIIIHFNELKEIFINNQGIITTNKGRTKSLIFEIIFLSSTKARVNIVLNLATSEGWKEKIPKFNHLWAPETEIPKK